MIYSDRRARRRRWRANAIDFAAPDIGTLSAKPLAPKAAIRAFQNKTVGGRVAYSHQDVWLEEHAASFVVAKAMREDVLQILYKGMDAAISEGRTLAQFRADVTGQLQDAGWWGKGLVRDPKDGKLKEAQLGSPRRLETIYRTNLRTARATGQWEGIEAVKDRFPYLEYVAVRDERTRDDHRALHGIVLPVDDTFWADHFPPNGWNCRCRVRKVSERRLKAKGLAVTTPGQLKARGGTATKQVRNRRTGDILTVARAVDPAFSYNPGRARLRKITPAPIVDNEMASAQPKPEDISHWGSAPGPDRLPFPQPRAVQAGEVLPEGVSATEALQAFLQRFPEPMMFDKAGIPLMVNEELFTQRNTKTGRVRLKVKKQGRERYTPLIARTLQDPDEIWYLEDVNTKTGAPENWRFYLSTFLMDDGKYMPVTVIFNDRGGQWMGSTGFQIERPSLGANLRYMQRRVRRGTLLYRRKDPETE